MSVESTIEGVFHNDPYALGEFFDNNYPPLYTYTLFRTGDKGISSDLTNQVFTQLRESIQKRKINPDQLPGWLYQTTASLIDGLPPLPIQPETSAETKLSQVKWLSSVVNRSLRLLPRDQQHFLALRFPLEFTLEEIAHFTGQTIADTRQLQYDALQSLRINLEQNT